ncbi:polysaccharide deacetylase family protein [Maledivibacter halophilus]|uniref:Predicted xylanase/chitin deacetylase n=1 Tax=Maledivibacter halophilus TaxID=36842 RepID=A0A1T5IVQ9_9FIRM|nr:polysaccharide deacetylase family protein [Maledivibacter halophilus]SKC43201.1 Predicted xylanase/chitin deacetylase [Maledivibacter halophilus]
MKTYIKHTIAIILSVTLFTGCTASTIKVDNKVENNGKNNDTKTEELVENNDKDKKEQNENNGNLKASQSNENSTNNDEHEDSKSKEINLQEIKPNELGQVMVIMYHALGDEEKKYIRSIENFKEDLKLLYEKGYRPVSLEDYINNNIDVEPGKTPVVLTFDDGNLSDFNVIEENGEKKIDPNSAIGILEEFNKKYPDFGLEATFYIYGENPFRQKNLIDYKLNYIVERGMDIGNHSFGHDKLSTLSKEEIKRTLARNVKFIKQYLPDYEVNTLSLPYGARPKDEETRKYLYKGSFEGIEYNNIGALAVGANPEHSSVHKEFDYEYINRVHGSSEEFGLRYWLEYFDKHPEKRYISDGDKDTVTIPESKSDFINEKGLGERKLRTYKLEETK